MTGVQTCALPIYRSRFETIGVSFGPDDKSDTRARVKSVFGQFLDVHDKSDAEIATMLRRMEIDIAVDLKGFTQDARPGIFALRPAPLQVSYLGYPGTLGADYIDYIFADAQIVGEWDRVYYSEKVVTLPGSYQPNDDKRRIDERTPSRTEAGLPERGFVFCSFNNNWKITRPVFAVWMRLLAQLPGSVLWLKRPGEAAAANLAEIGRAHV